MFFLEKRTPLKAETPQPKRLTIPNAGISGPQCPEGMPFPEFLNSPVNIKSIVETSGFARLEELIAFQKAMGHSPDTDFALMYNEAESIEDPGGRPMMLHELSSEVRAKRGKLLHAALAHMAKEYPDAESDMVMLASGSIDGEKGYKGALQGKRSVPSIFMNHAHAIAFSRETLQGNTAGTSTEEINLKDDPSLNDNGFDPILEKYVSRIFSDYFSGLNLKYFDISSNTEGAGIIQGFPMGLPPFKIKNGRCNLLGV